MKNKPIDARLHGLFDYAFGGVQLMAPTVLGLNLTAIKNYKLIGAGFSTVNALTDTPVGIKPVISLQAHKRIDEVSLISQSFLTLAPFIRNDKRALAFHLLFLGAAITNYLLTDYKDGE